MNKIHPLLDNGSAGDKENQNPLHEKTIFRTRQVKVVPMGASQLKHTAFMSILSQSRQWICVHILLSFSIFLLMYGILKGFNLNYSRVKNTNPSTIHGFTNIVLLGDSLIEFPYELFNLGGLLYNHLSDYKVNIISEGVGSDTILRIRERLPGALSKNPDVLVLLWDTDCSDTNENNFSKDEVQQIRSSYEENVRYTINATLAVGAKFVIVSGPIILGEGNWMMKHKFKGKEQMVLDYIDINERICNDMNVTYLNMREPFREAIPSYWPFSMWMVTFDGEHPNIHGTQIIAKKLAQRISTWLEQQQNIVSSS